MAMNTGHLGFTCVPACRTKLRIQLHHGEILLSHDRYENETV